MKLIPIMTGLFKLDGGAMFGVVPKNLWSRTNPADEHNMCSWAMRCLLIDTGERVILIDNGIGEKQSEKFFSYYYLHGDYSLEKSLKENGYHPDDITDMFLTHLHFDHCGGGIIENDKGDFVPYFKNATYWSNKDHWKWATEPNDREKASFLKENILPMEQSGQLKFVEKEGELFPGFSIRFYDGHTDKQMIPFISYKNETIVFTADLLPSTGHIPLPYVMGYDTRPLLTLAEKKKFLNEAADHNYVLYLEHDYYSECCRVHHTEKGVRLKETFDLSSIL
ncbi:MAG: MBL fold metallo-hydrolase [Flavobacteriales bacterium]|nr:MBL fold metallo-hydrolase [Flavobacteriales bacterium]